MIETEFAYKSLKQFYTGFYGSKNSVWDIY